LALGEQEAGRLPGDSYLITASLDDTEPLSTFIEVSFAALAAGRRARIRQRLAVALARLLARMHDAGALHNDLHAANLLIRLADDDQVQLFVVDLHAVRLGPPLSWKAGRDNLVLLNRWFSLRVSRADRLRFWQEYCRTRTVVGGPWPLAGLPSQSANGAWRSAIGRAARELERLTLRSNWLFWRSRDRRCLRNNPYFRRVRSGVASGHAVTDFSRDVLDALLADPDEPFRRPDITLLKDTRSSTVAELDLPVGGVPRRVIYKRFRVTRASYPWLALVRWTPALRSWIHGHGLRERGLPTPRPLAVFHRRRFGLPCEGYVITEKIPDTVNLQTFLAGLSRLVSAGGRRTLRQRTDQVAELVRRLHQRRLSHRDLKAANILVSVGAVSGSSSPPLTTYDSPFTTHSLWLIDLVGVTNWQRLPRRRRVQNLARLHASFAQNPAVTRTDKLRFLRAYMQWGSVGRERWKQWWHEIDRATRAKVARNLRTGRPLA
jgi:tRNA A-37 threonylcarbamoyl transferase component Bud32